LPHIDVSKLPKKYLVGYEKPSVDTGNETIWNEMKDKLLNPYFSPIVAKSLENLPPAYVFTAEHDPLRDEGILYARRLEESGVKVTHTVTRTSAYN
jgi:acetyl esterase/lipase